ncbi:amidase domain-containing protein [Demequina sp.]|uniref:amidase domain-containing protein n=1 Tax=Demequina sp. TaxID=2050685 RepID=UPI003A84A3B8
MRLKAKTWATAAAASIPLLLASTASAVASPSARFVALEAELVADLQLEEMATSVVAAVQDAGTGEVEITSSTELGSSIIEHLDGGGLDTDVEATVDALDQELDLSTQAREQVAALIDSDRAHLDKLAGAGIELGIEAVEVATTDLAATLDARNDQILVEAETLVSHRYDSGIVGQMLEETTMIVDAVSGELLAIDRITEADYADAASLTDPGWFDDDDLGSEVGEGIPGPSETAEAQLDAVDDDTWIEVGPVSARGYSAPLITGIGSSGRSYVVNYARKYALTPNRYYRTYTSDCTNFVSQAVRAGGWSFKNGWYRSNGAWYYSSTGVTSFTWAGAENWFRFARVESKRAKTITRFSQVVPGDIIQVKFKGKSNIGHSMVVTGVSKGEIYVSYHSSNKRDVKFSAFDATYTGEQYFIHRL